MVSLIFNKNKLIMNTVMLKQNDNNSSRLSIGSNSSISRSRITRKNDSSKRSMHSKSKGKDISFDNGFASYYQNYVKKGIKKEQSDFPDQPILSKSQTTRQRDTPIKHFPNDIRNGQDRAKQEKKRQVTPVKSRKQLKNSIQQTINHISFEKQLLLTQLQQNLKKEKALRKKIQQQLSSNHKQLNHSEKIIKQIQIENRILLEQKKIYEQRIRQLEKVVLEGQTNLNAAQTTLNKLKKTIKQNRIQQLQQQVKIQSKKIEELASEKNKLSAENSQLIKDLGKSIKEAEQLRKRVDIVGKYKTESLRENFLQNQLEKLKLRIQTSKTQIQHFLEGQLKNRQQIIFQLQSENKGLKIKMHYLEHSKNQQMREIKEQKQSEIKMIRVKYSQLIQDMKSKKQQASKRKTNHHQGHQILERPRKRSEVLLQLSPQY